MSPEQLNASAGRSLAALAQFRDGPDQQFALVLNGQIVLDGQAPIIMRCPDQEKPRLYAGSEWLPVDLPAESRDSQPFDQAKHWRQLPRYLIEGRKVIRLYPVVVKSMELA